MALNKLPSSRGPGHVPFTDATGVQISLGVNKKEVTFVTSFLVTVANSELLQGVALSVEFKREPAEGGGLMSK